MVVRNHTVLVAFLLAVLFSSCQQQYEFGIPEDSNHFNSNIYYNNKVDFVFIVDDSMTMDATQKRLAETMPGLIRALLALKMDFHFAVISTSMGGGQYRGGKFLGSPRVLDSSTPNLAAELSARLKMGSDGRDVEAGLESLLTVLSPTYLSTDGQGFLRDEALLAVLAITNEDDHSKLGDANFYIQFLDLLKGRFDNGDRKWQFNLIGALDTTGRCATNPEFGYTEKSAMFIDLVNASKGKMESICSTNLAPAVGNIKARIVEILTDYRLKREPDVSTIRVYSNNRLVPRSSTNGWDYIPDLNVIRFYGSWIPAADVEIRVEFLPAKPD